MYSGAGLTCLFTTGSVEERIPERITTYGTGVQERFRGNSRSSGPKLNGNSSPKFVILIGTFSESLFSVS